ncbi:MAG: hypothetical protein HY544_00540 [Candidatus Diapherotrites archaeon]|uniref:Uncharacterized protein n=1 Tax=Candidatus Iainarchaeum sp. TaxID=3101447 RepID=A0A8T3YJX9_9ARCH|nr:hypothetical protein [Candidatus Diapherotrites archaeon]
MPEEHYIAVRKSLPDEIVQRVEADPQAMRIFKEAMNEMIAAYQHGRTQPSTYEGKLDAAIQKVVAAIRSVGMDRYALTPEKRAEIAEKFTMHMDRMEMARLKNVPRARLQRRLPRYRKP